MFTWCAACVVRVVPASNSLVNMYPRRRYVPAEALCTRGDAY